jgi:hypothetical protein
VLLDLDYILLMVFVNALKEWQKWVKLVNIAKVTV